VRNRCPKLIEEGSGFLSSEKNSISYDAAHALLELLYENQTSTWSRLTPRQQIEVLKCCMHYDLKHFTDQILTLLNGISEVSQMIQLLKELELCPIEQTEMILLHRAVKFDIPDEQLDKLSREQERKLNKLHKSKNSSNLALPSLQSIGVDPFPQQLQDLFNSRNKTGDLVIQLDGEDFSVHRFILAAQSPYLREFFERKEIKQKKHIHLDLDQFTLSCSTFKSLLLYFYTMNLRDLTADQALEILSLATLWKLEEHKMLLAYCEKALIKDIKLSNCLSHLQKVKDLKEVHSLVEALISFIASNYQHFHKKPEFELLDLPLKYQVLTFVVDNNFD